MQSKMPGTCTLKCPDCRGDPAYFAPSKCTRCGGIGTVVAKKRVHTFPRKQLGLNLYANVKDNKVMVAKACLACKAGGILPGSQLLSVNGTPVTDMEHVEQLIKDASLPIKAVFMCPKNPTKVKKYRKKMNAMKKKVQEQLLLKEKNYEESVVNKSGHCEPATDNTDDETKNVEVDDLECIICAGTGNLSQDPKKPKPCDKDDEDFCEFCDGCGDPSKHTDVSDQRRRLQESSGRRLMSRLLAEEARAANRA